MRKFRSFMGKIRRKIIRIILGKELFNNFTSGIRQTNDKLDDIANFLQQSNGAVNSRLDSLQQDSVAINSKLDYSINFLQLTTDITKILSARRNMRMIQDCSVALLSVFAQIAEKHNIKWWLDGGGLIGHFRHKGLIPWDNDIDIAMMREDYIKCLAALSEEFSKNGFHFSHGEITRLFYKNTPAQVDIFPIDSGDTIDIPAGHEYDKFIDTLCEIKSHIHPDYSNLLKQLAPSSLEDVNAAIAEGRDILVRKPLMHGFLFYGVEALVSYNATRALYLYEDVFPLKSVMFLGVKAWIPNNAEYWLFKQYGDFMDFPLDFHSHSDINTRLTQDNYKECQRFISEYLPKTNSMKNTDEIK